MRGVEILEIFSWNREKDFLILITLKTGEMTLLNIVDNVIGQSHNKAFWVREGCRVRRPFYSANSLVVWSTSIVTFASIS